MVSDQSPNFLPSNSYPPGTIQKFSPKIFLRLFEKSIQGGTLTVAGYPNLIIATSSNFLFSTNAFVNCVVPIITDSNFPGERFVLSKIVETFNEKKVDIVYGDLVYVKKNDINNVIRYWQPGIFKDKMFLKGWSPPHPSFIVKKKLFESLGFYKAEIGNSADIELMHRYLQENKVKHYYINETFVKMRYGGSSNKNIVNIVKQNIQILKFLNINKNFFKVFVFFYYKFFDRLKQFFIKKI